MFEKVRQQRLSSAALVGGLVVIVALTGVVAGGAQAANPGNSQNAKACQKGGWEDLARSEDYSGFSSEEECVSYAARGGTLVNPLALCQQQLVDAGLSAPADANYILGTPGGDNFTSQMTAGNDVICGFAGHDVILSSAELEGDDIFLGGDGNDSVVIMSGGTFNGGAGDDAVGHMSGGIFDGGAGDDLVDIMRGGDGGSATFNGGTGDDSVNLLLGGGTFNGGDGCDSVRDSHGTFNPGDQSTCTA